MAKAMTRGIAIVLCLVFLGGFEEPYIRKDRAFYEKRGEIVWEVPLEVKKIALTFDDGPYPATTEPILDLLKEYGAKATFFVLGNRVERYPETVKREVEEGHEVANHTFNHVYFKDAIKSITIQEEIVSTDRLLMELTGRKPMLFRPPGGFYSEESIRIAKQLGYTTVLWSWHKDTNDWRSPGVGYIVRKVLNNTRNGDIVLLHDYIPGSRQTVEALKQILPELKKQGFQIVTVSELLHDKAGAQMPIGL